MFLDFEEVHRWCTILNKKEDMAIREQLMQFQIKMRMMTMLFEMHMKRCHI